MDSAPLETELVVPERPPRRRCRCFQCPPCNSCRCRVALAAGLLLFCALVGLITAWVIRPNSVEYSEDTAVRLAQLAGAAYCSRTALEAWTCGSKCLTSVSKPVKVCQGETTQAFVARWEGDALISFEGTKSYLSMVQDLRIWKNLTDWKSHGKSSVASVASVASVLSKLRGTAVFLRLWRCTRASSLWPPQCELIPAH